MICSLFFFQITRHQEDENLLLNSLKSFQFFYGVLIAFLGSISILRVFKYKNFEEMDCFLIKFLIIFISFITIFELITVNFLIDREDFILYKNIYVPINEAASIKTRPIGVALYAQPNSIYIAYLLILDYVVTKKFNPYTYIGIFGLLFSLGGTGIVIYAFYIFLTIGIKYLLPGIFFMIFLYFISQNYEMFSAKINIDYWAYLINNFIEYYDSIFSNFTFQEYLFGINKFEYNYNPGFTHDWAFLDILYEAGIFGLIIYICIYSLVLRWAFYKINSKYLLMFTIFYIIIFSNFHYAGLNFYFGQMLFGVIGAINYCMYHSLKKNTTPNFLGSAFGK